MRVLVTGAAGFIGYHTAARLLDRGHEVIGFDNLSPYYDVSLKEARLQRLKEQERFRFIKGDLADRSVVEATFAEERPERSFISPARRPLSSTTRTPISAPTSRASCTSSRAAGTTAWSISSMPRRARSMARTEALLRQRQYRSLL
jgi:NAD(P)-dependent dehydrogenase (short-subunit alcohol dehydrogenase family)